MNIVSQIRIYDLIDIIIVSVLVYYFILFIKETKAIQLIKGIFLLFIITFFAQLVRLNTLNWILERIFTIGIISLVIIFQPELRNVLRKLGTEQLLPFSTLLTSQVNELLGAIKHMSENKIGSIIVLERTTPLGSYGETGCKIDSNIDNRLLTSIFSPGNPLHDGAVIIQHNRISAAGCILPVNPEPPDTTRGTRHSAALKMSQDTDALVIITSEETGQISVAQKGKIFARITVDGLRKRIENTFQIK